MFVIAIANQKGGVGKTATSINLAYSLATLGKSVLLIDFDPQANCDMALGKKTQTNGIYEALHGMDINSCVGATTHPNMFVMTSSQNLAAFEIELIEKPNREFKLHQALEKLAVKFDYILIDCSPALGLLTINAMVAANFVLIPVQPEIYSLNGVKLLMDTMRKVKNLWNPKLEMIGMLITMFQNTILHQQLKRELQDFFGDILFNTIIGRSISIAEAAATGNSAYNYSKHSNGAKAYMTLASEVIKRCESNNV
jgi:chromosome partitioning protein